MGWPYVAFSRRRVLGAFTCRGFRGFRIRVVTHMTGHSARLREFLGDPEGPLNLAHGLR